MLTLHEKADSNSKYMDNETNTQPTPAAAPAPTAAPLAAPTDARRPSYGRGGAQGQGAKRRDRGDRPARAERPRAEFEQKIIALRRVTRVVAGGRRFSFSVALVAGDKKGRVGVGLGKAGDTSLAIDKALRDAKKHMIRIPITKTNSIPHEVYAKYSSGRIIIKPAPGRGVVAGSAARSILELAGIKDVMAKIVSPSKNQLNVAQAALKALKSLNPSKK